MIETLNAFCTMRWGRFADRAAIAAHHVRLWAALRSGALTRSPLYAAHAADPDWHGLPAMDRARMMAAFGQITTTGLSRAEAEALARMAEPGAARTDGHTPARTDGLAAGFSTGSAGQRGLFVTGPRERRLWAAALAGRFWPRPALRPQRIALFLRADNPLYHAMNMPGLRLRHFDATAPAADHLSALRALRPTVLAGPPSVLLAVGAAAQTAGLRLAPRVVLCGAEPAEPQDRAQLRTIFGVRPDIIYQCTEGVLAMTCTHGRLHLNERFAAFDREVIDTGSGAFVPIITDLTRTSLPVLNYRLDDVLIPDHDPAPCPCGCASTRITRIEGRLADSVWWRGADGPRWISSEALRRIAMTLPGVTDWALTQTAPDAVRFHVSGGPGDTGHRIDRGCRLLARASGCDAPQVHVVTTMPPPDGIKRRRVRGLGPPPGWGL